MDIDELGQASDNILPMIEDQVNDAIPVVEKHDDIELDESGGPPKKRRKGDRSLAGLTESGEPKKKSYVGKNAVVIVNEMFPGITYNLVSQTGQTHAPRFTMSAEVEGTMYAGTGSNKKAAKLDCAVKILQHCNPEALEQSSSSLHSIDESQVAFTQDTFVDNFSQSFTSAEAVQERPKQQHQQPIGKSPVMILNELFPGSQYSFVVEQGEKEKKSFAVTVTVDGKGTYQAVGRNKKLAKARAAQVAVEQICGLKEFNYTADEMPFYVGSDQCWLKFKESKPKTATPSFDVGDGKNPIMELNELWSGLQYVHHEPVKDGGPTMHRVTLQIENTEYSGTGFSKKEAKFACAASAIDTLKRQGTWAKQLALVTEQRKLRMAKAKVQNDNKVAGTPGQQKPNTASVKKQSLQQSGAPEKKVLKNAVVKLNEKYQGLSYQQVEGTGRGNIRCQVHLTIDSRQFVGFGPNKRIAKMEAAVSALKGLSLWTHDDELARIDYISNDKKKAENEIGKRQKINEKYGGIPPWLAKRDLDGNIENKGISVVASVGRWGNENRVMNQRGRGQGNSPNKRGRLAGMQRGSGSRLITGRGGSEASWNSSNVSKGNLFGSAPNQGQWFDSGAANSNMAWTEAKVNKRGANAGRNLRQGGRFGKVNKRGTFGRQGVQSRDAYAGGQGEMAYEFSPNEQGQYNEKYVENVNMNPNLSYIAESTGTRGRGGGGRVVPLFKDGNNFGTGIAQKGVPAYQQPTSSFSNQAQFKSVHPSLFEHVGHRGQRGRSSGSASYSNPVASAQESATPLSYGAQQSYGGYAPERIGYDQIDSNRITTYESSDYGNYDTTGYGNGFAPSVATDATSFVAGSNMVTSGGGTGSAYIMTPESYAEYYNLQVQQQQQQQQYSTSNVRSNFTADYGARPVERDVSQPTAAYLSYGYEHAGYANSQTYG